MLTMLLGGLWHGAAWNFVLWGGYQGALLSVHRFVFPVSSATTTPIDGRGKFIHAVKIITFFQLVCYGWILFRAESISQIANLTQALVGFNWSLSNGFLVPPIASLAGLFMLFFWELQVYLQRKHSFYNTFPLPMRALVYSTFLIKLLFGLKNDSTEFIYFQF